MDYKVVKNLLDKDYFLKLKNQFINSHLSYYFQKVVAHLDDKEQKNQFYFTHLIYKDHKPNSDYFETLLPLLNKIECKSLILIKVNLYTRTEKIIKHKPHVDNSFSHKGLVLSLNTCDGGTMIGNKFIKSIDTSNPVMAALEGVMYKESGLTEKPKANMNDHFDIKFEDVDYLMVLHNTTLFREINGLKKLSPYVKGRNITPF